MFILPDYVRTKTDLASNMVSSKCEYCLIKYSSHEEINEMWIKTSFLSWTDYGSARIYCT